MHVLGRLLPGEAKIFAALRSLLDEWQVSDASAQLALYPSGEIVATTRAKRELMKHHIGRELLKAINVKVA